MLKLKLRQRGEIQPEQLGVGDVYIRHFNQIALAGVVLANTGEFLNVIEVAAAGGLGRSVFLTTERTFDVEYRGNGKFAKTAARFAARTIANVEASLKWKARNPDVMGELGAAEALRQYHRLIQATDEPWVVTNATS